MDPQLIFDGLHKQLSFDFGIELPKKEIFDRTHIPQKEILMDPQCIFMAYVSTPKITLG